MLNKLVLEKSTLAPKLLDSNTIFVSQGYEKEKKLLINQYLLKKLPVKKEKLHLYKKILKLTMLKKLCFSKNSQLLLKFVTIKFIYYDLEINKLFDFEIVQKNCIRGKK